LTEKAHLKKLKNMPKLIGQKLGRYQILELLGEGGMATVYKAHDTRLEREVAIKITRHDAFPPNQLGTILKRFEREAKALAGLSHPNIVNVMDYGEYEGLPYLVMVYLSGGTLSDRLGKPMPWDNAVQFLLPVVRALEYTHEHNIIHRDIKPSNILMTEKGQPMLTDFGLVKIFVDKGETNLTASGMGLGTPDYMAPEQWTGEATAQSDLYSLGVVLYEMITGHRPYSSDTPAGILLKQVNEPLPLPSQYVSDLPQNVESALLKALASKPDDRYPDMRSFANELQDLLEGREVSAKAINANMLHEHMTGKMGRQPATDQNKVVQTQIKQGRNAALLPAPAKTQRGGNGFKIVAGGISVGLCACFALAVVGFFAMNGFKSAPTQLSAASATAPQKISTETPASAVAGLSSIKVSGCIYTDDCSDAVLIEDLFGKNETLEFNTEYTAPISQDQKVNFFSGWCAVDLKTLNENLKNMKFVLTIDGKSYIQDTMRKYFDQQNETDSKKQKACYGVGGVVSGWQQAHTYRVVIGQIFEKSIFDGWDNYPQAEQLNIYLITVK
jgi:tRNA A-37 threonylcarbamoyl transferase component Bud32